MCPFYNVLGVYLPFDKKKKGVYLPMEISSVLYSALNIELNIE